MTQPSLPELLDDVQDVFYVLDDQFRFAFLNATARRALGLTPDALGKKLGDVLPQAVSGEGYRRLQDALGQQRAAHFEVFSAVMRRWVSLDAYPSGGGLIVYHRDIHERKQAEEHARALATISTSLIETASPREVAEVLVRVVPPALGVAFAVVVALDEDDEVLRVIAANGLPEESFRNWAAFPLASPVPLATAAREGYPVFVHSREEAEQSFQVLLSVENTHEAWAALPLRFEAHTFGALGLSFPTPRLFDPAEQAFLNAVAAQAAQALERTRSQEAEARARQYGAFLTRASSDLANSLDLNATLESLARLAVPAVADWCAVYLPQGEELRVVTVAHQDPAKVELVRAVTSAVALRIDDPGGAPEVLRTGKPLFVPVITPALISAQGRDPDHTRQVHALGLRSYLGVPMVAHGRTVGVLAFALAETERHYDAQDLDFALELARRAGVALDHARLYQEAQQWAATLERTVEDRTRELAARNRALDAFGVLSRDLAVETDRVKLLRRAQQILLTLLPHGVTGYFELDAGRWQVRSLEGEMPDGTVEAVLLRGLPHGEAPLLDVPFDTQAPLYQDHFEPNTGHLSPEALARLLSTASFPVGTGSGLFGVLVIALYHQHGWTQADRVLLETAMGKVRLALERAEAVEGLARRTAELEELNAELDAFTSSVSHDLRAPLRHIMGFSSVLRRAVGEDAPDRVLRPLGIIETSAARLTRLTDALLSFARTSRQPLSVVDLDLNGLVREACEDLHLETTGAQVEVRVGTLPTVRGDPTLLRQVMVNLLGNAVKYSALNPAPVVTVSAYQDPGETVVTVADNGVGFDPQYADKLFGMFSRLHRADEFEGSGVGLAMVKRVVQRHGGRVWAESTPGEGAAFHIGLPRHV
ncbi:GAF domain-containing protein [Deinococcus apachensis]|uniref:GAF domain-containing protein n=1 Tax=Deinococcus apachensis TaxID=309886 RepID=UPI000372BDD0|nr:GAF domain-containing protein [Deinococcus apachensis]